MFHFIKDKLSKIYQAVTSKLAAIFSKTTVDDSTLHELKILLIQADAGVKTTDFVIEQLRKQVTQGIVTDGNNLRDALEPLLVSILEKPQKPVPSTKVFVLVGINGSGKTTFAAKLAHDERKSGKRVLLVAADTFRAAAQDQLAVWAERAGVAIETGVPNQDPSSVVYAGCARYAREQFDTIIIDTAGRLQTKTNLMQELSKIKRTIAKHVPDEPIMTLLTIDAMLGQNSFEQAKLFKDATQVSGIVLTKMDGTGKGGIVFGIAHELEIPVAYVTFGEAHDSFKAFDARDYVQNLLNK